VVLKLGHFGKYIRDTLDVLKCGVGEGWRLCKHYYKEIMMVKLIGHFLRKNCILKYDIKGNAEKK